MKTKEQVQKYNKEYSSRPEVIAWAKIRNARPERKETRKKYKQTEASKKANIKYRNKPETKERVKNRYMINRYGINLDRYNELLLEQGGVCAVCHIDKAERLHVDHDHNTGVVRGLLCGSCNRAIGLMKDDTDILNSAIEYLKNEI
jgi:hypothetical protein